MLENLNNSLFYLINATPDSAQWTISLAIFIAKDLISIYRYWRSFSGFGGRKTA